ncbi:MAG: sll1863 family stress response protein [Gaiellaceae bacterium]
MATAIEDRLEELKSRIEALDARAYDGGAEATERIERHLERLRQDDEAAEAAALRRSREYEALYQARLQVLESELKIAEHHLDAEIADDRKQFVAAVDAELADWDALMERMQANAAAKAGAAREESEKVIADLRRRRLAIGESLAGVRAAVGDTWRDGKKRVLAALDELKRKADAARPN